MKIHQDGVVARTPPRKAVSFRDVDGVWHSGRTPLRETNGRTPLKSPHSNAKSDLFKSPMSTKKTSMTSNSFRQGLKKGFTPSSTKTNTRPTTDSEKENNLESKWQKLEQQYQLNQKSVSKTPGSASALRRTLRSTIQPREKQQSSKTVSDQNKVSSRGTSGSAPFQSVQTAMTYSSSYATSSLAGRSRLLGKGGLAPGKSMMSTLGPPARVAPKQSNLGPPKRVAPKTPNTLLRTELEDDDEVEESFLLSPPPGALWNALNLTSGGDKKHTISPTVTTGLIVVSPQTADQIHTWSSTKKQLPTTDKVSPTVPRALMQTPHGVAPKTTTPAPTGHPIQDSRKGSRFSDLATPKEHIVTATKDESIHSKKEEAFIVATNISSKTTSNREGEFNSQADEMLQRSVKKATKGGVVMDMTGFFTLEENSTQKKHEKKWAKSTPLSSSMPDALLSRLNSKRPVTSKKTRNKENRPPLMAPKGTSSKMKVTSTKTKPPISKPTALSTRSHIPTKNAASNRGKSASSTGITKRPMRQDENITRHVEKTVAIDTAKMTSSSKPWERNALKKNKVVEKNKAPRAANHKAATEGPVKPWKMNAAKRKQFSKGAEKDKSNFTDKTLTDNGDGKEVESIHRGGLTFDVTFTKSHNRKAVTKDARKPLKKSSESKPTDIQKQSKAADSIPRGGVAFDVGFRDAGNDTRASKPSLNRKKTITNPSLKSKIKDPGNSKSLSDRQCEVFVGWLNYILNPEEMDVNNEGSVASGLRALIIHRRLAEGRVNALNLFRGDSMRQVRTAISKEISRGKLSIRADRDVSVDVHLRKKLTSLLLSYTTPWLRLALEVMSGECIEPVPISETGPKSYLGRMKLSLEHFIKKSFLSDESTLQKFTKGRFSVLSGKWETKYKEEMRNLVLARIMILVFFLDRAKASNVLENVPRLFTVSSNVKSTRDVLLTITRDCLSAEGDIVKHLSRIGLKISYVQDPVDEVNFRVTNLATDLRDGVLLTRLSEIVAAKPFKSCMSSLRLPVISRLQKKFNVNLAFSAFKDFGIVISDEINAHHVMDGHKEMVLALMWCIIGHSCLEKLLQGDHVEQEIKNVIQSSLARKKLEGKTFSENEHLVLEPSIKGVRGKDFSADEILQELLLRWSRAVCSSFGLTLDNLSGSFANGEALCMLVHYYHPSLIPINDIFSKNPLSDRYKSKFDLYSEEEILAKEHQNWERASKSMLELGGIPDMLPICDSKNPPNEKSMLLCLSYLCSRLMESSNEIFATILIQACYRKYRSKVLMEKKMAAASTIFRIWTRCKSNYFRQQEQQFKGQVAILENFVLTHKHSLKRMKKARLEREQLIRSVTTVQRVFRGRLGRARFKEILGQRIAANVIQRNFRRYLAIRISKELSNRRDSAVIIQSAFRRFKAHEIFLDYRHYIIEIQRYFRGYIARKELKAKDFAALVIQEAWWSYMANTEMELAATFLQKFWRGVLGRRKWIEHATRRDAAFTIQKVWRGYYQTLNYSIALQSSIVLQKVMRGFLGRKAISFHRHRHAATSIQKIWRGFSAQVQYQIDVLDIVCVQSLVRRFLSRRQCKKRMNALSILQCGFRCSIARRQMAVKNQERMEERLHTLMASASTKIQSMYRAGNCRSSFLRSKMAAIDIQRSYRGFVSRKSDHMRSFAATLIQCTWRRYWAFTDYTIYLNEINSATLIQAHVRRMATMKMIASQNSLARIIQHRWQKYKQYKLETSSATKIQSIFRSNLSRLRFLELKRASLILQQMARSRQARKILLLKQQQHQYEQSAIAIQKIWRGFSKQVQFQIDMMDVICVQSVCRRHIVSRAYNRSVLAVSLIQRAFRCSAARRERKMRKLVLDTMVMESSIRIQRAVRGFILRSKYLMTKAALIHIQKTWRGYTSRKYLAHAAQDATRIQSCWRRYRSKKNYLSLKKHRAATMIQSHWRRCFAQNNFLLDLLEIKSATLIQATFRMYMHRLDYMVIKYSAHTIQRYTRGLLSRVDLAVKHFAATEIQRIWRGHCTCSLKSMVCSAVKIQSLVRMVFAKEKVNTLRSLHLAEIRNRDRKASIIQTSFRKYTLYKKRDNAARIIQHIYRSRAETKCIRAASRGVINLQSRFRGAQVRKTRSKKVAQVARRIQIETRRALKDPTLRLGYRTSRALEILQTSQSLTKIMEAVKELEASTRLSVVCCQVFTKVNAANILLYLIQSCNRSVPHMELKEHILLTLENVAQYPSLVGSFAHYKYAEVFLDNVQVFRDKDGIFCLAVTLLGRITKAEKDVAQFCATHEHLKRLKEVYRVVSRRKTKSKKNKNRSAKARLLRERGLAKRDDFDRIAATRLLKEMIDVFSQIDVPHITATPKSKFNWNELQYSPLL